MTLAQNQAKRAICQECDHEFEYESRESPDICLSCEAEQAVVSDAKQYAKLRRNSYWGDPKKFDTYDSEETKRMARGSSSKLFVFRARGHKRIVTKLPMTGTWGVLSSGIDDQRL